MTTYSTVDFVTNKTSDIPRAGQRKRVKLNGKLETLHVGDVNVKFRHDRDGKPEWSGSYTLMPYYDMVGRPR